MSNSPSVPEIFKFQKSPTKKSDVFFDSHAHIQYPEFKDLDPFIQRAKQIGLRGVVCVGIDHKTSQQALEIHKANSDYIYPTIGNHPYNADQDFQPIYDQAHQYKDSFIGIGETGLDYFKNKLSKSVQKESLLNHAKLAKELDLPIILHLRELDDCWADCWDILKKAQYPKAIFHCFTGSLDQAKEIWSHGYKTSFSLLITYPKNQVLKEIYQNCPPEHLLIETDSPYLPPQDLRGQTNEPSYLSNLS